ncbi:hypothetical protein WGT02_34035 (plasmid) [Rhizobium sp. T1470]|uniref:hypothetical protein n=1 Tax=unclassified Rhizobium TaxID=2613769 RepID=UPI001AAF083E|nr:hypothetical protein [Rhizobium sp. T1473]
MMSGHELERFLVANRRRKARRAKMQVEANRFSCLIHAAADHRLDVPDVIDPWNVANLTKDWDSPVLDGTVKRRQCKA